MSAKQTWKSWCCSSVRSFVVMLKMTGWWEHWMTGWLDDWMTWWLDDQMTRWPDRVTEWPSDRMTKWPSNRKLRRRLTGWYIFILNGFPVLQQHLPAEIWFLIYHNITFIKKQLQLIFFGTLKWSHLLLKDLHYIYIYINCDAQTWVKQGWASDGH